MPLILFGVYPSQPVRAIMWTCMLKKLKFDFQLTIPGKLGKNGARNPEYLKIVPSGKVPAISDDGFTLYESAAILCYLAEKNSWTDLYPVDIQSRAKIHQYLHWHHENTRDLSRFLVSPIFLGLPKQPKETVDKKINAVLSSLEQIFTEHKYVCGSELSIADFLCFCEVSQLLPQFLNLWTFENYPQITRWLNEMQKLPKFEESHTEFVNVLQQMKKKSKI